MLHFSLHGSWSFKPASNNTPHTAHLDWMPATVPGSVQQDLLSAGLIPDPFFGMQEKDVQWIGEQDWLYRCVFTVPEELSAYPFVDLVCEGLDTEATVWLNGHEVVASHNMFIPVRKTVTRWLRPGDNELTILFASPWQVGKALEAQRGVLRHWNGDASRLYIRKAQYHYGWDWGPTLLTLGPWLPVRLESYEARIRDLYSPVTLSDDLRTASFSVAVELDLPAALSLATVELSVADPSGTVIAQATLPARGNHLQHVFDMSDPLLWWPHGYGEQPRYRVQAALVLGTRVADTRDVQVGVRKLELVRRPLQDVQGESFFFRVNNTSIFCGGVNWIPADLMLSRVTEERYRDWLTLAIEANMVMVRVWGGGIYENDVFYDLCDELGLLVWQDFMFACGVYPAHEEMLASLRTEFEVQIKRLRNHPSLALWCGNNEDYWITNLSGLYTPEVLPDADSWFPARVMYERLLPELCGQLDPTRSYWPGSPYGGTDPNSQFQGDRHVWEIWNAPVDPYQKYPEWRGRFVSEFGMLGAPALETLREALPEPEQYFLSPFLAWHNKAEYGEERLNTYLKAMGREIRDLTDFIYLSQLVQVEALSWAFRGWRRFWRGEGREEVGGALVWQLNDCWPAISWALVDNKLRPKPAYYEARRALAPLALGAMRTGNQQAEIWVMNQGAEVHEAEVIIKRWTLDGQLRGSATWHGTLPVNRSLELPVHDLIHDEILALRLIVNGHVQARFAIWPEGSHEAYPDPRVQITRLEGERVRVTAATPARSVLRRSINHYQWSDNMLDVMPDDPQFVDAPSIGKQQITIQWFK